MSPETHARDELVAVSRSLFERGLTAGSTGNLSLRLEDGGLLVTPTGRSLGSLDPERLSRFDEGGRFVSGDPPTKEMPLHSAFYETRGSRCGAVVHLHSTHSVAVSLLPDIDPDAVFAPLTAYSVMRLGRVKLLPYYRPGDPEMGEAVRRLEGRRGAVLLAHHGPVVAGTNLASAVDAMEEMEETAKLTLLTHGRCPACLSEEQVRDIRTQFNVEWAE